MFHFIGVWGYFARYFNRMKARKQQEKNLIQKVFYLQRFMNDNSGSVKNYIKRRNRRKRSTDDLVNAATLMAIRTLELWAIAERSSLKDPGYINRKICELNRKNELEFGPFGRSVSGTLSKGLIEHLSRNYDAASGQTKRGGEGESCNWRAGRTKWPSCPICAFDVY